ncbi:Hypothetical protein NTJ_00401 [Nesidiocoris tenuis]|uniref:Uncharacterized protein n=1 Tax=Nesidiocoris tenuis TaxID=355587 RepID=A0ABN7A601_9HEMI|nr:Hypothetical protein NTJ_00401 [Nesidiocoris tenuis]
MWRSGETEGRRRRRGREGSVFSRILARLAEGQGVRARGNECLHGGSAEEEVWASITRGRGEGGGQYNKWESAWGTPRQRDTKTCGNLEAGGGRRPKWKRGRGGQRQTSKLWMGQTDKSFDSRPALGCWGQGGFFRAARHQQNPRYRNNRRHYDLPS